MTTRQTCEELAAATYQFPFLGTITPEILQGLIRDELGHEAALDDFQQVGGRFIKCVPPKQILHVISGNTPHAGLQSLMRGLLLQSHNFCKIPSEGLPELVQFRDALSPTLQKKIEINSALQLDWLDRADALIVFGNDETIAHFRAVARPEQIFIAHGHKVSAGVIFLDPQFNSVALAARDASLFDQQGCLSPQVFYVDETNIKLTAYAERLAVDMELFNSRTPRGKISASDAAGIFATRDEYAFLAANDPEFRIWKSANSDWTVILDRSNNFPKGALNRVVFVKPWITFAESIRAASRYLSTLAIWPATLENAKAVADSGATRICPVGEMQSPRFDWHQDGGQNLAPLVRWIDVELGETFSKERKGSKRDVMGKSVSDS